MFRTCVNGLFVATLLLSGCNRERVIALPAVDNTTVMMAATAAGAAPTAMLDPKVVRIASARIKVQAVDAAVDSVGSIVRSVGGQIRGRAECRDGYGTKTLTLNCEIPAEKLDAALARIRELGRVEMLTVRSNEVSEESLDLETRLANEKAFERASCGSSTARRTTSPPWSRSRLRSHAYAEVSIRWKDNGGRWTARSRSHRSRSRCTSPHQRLRPQRKDRCDGSAHRFERRARTSSRRSRG